MSTSIFLLCCTSNQIDSWSFVHLACSQSQIRVPPAAFTAAESLTLESWAREDCQRLLEGLGSSIFGTGETVSDCLALYPERTLTRSNMTMSFSLRLNKNSPAASVRVSCLSWNLERIGFSCMIFEFDEACSYCKVGIT